MKRSIGLAWMVCMGLACSALANGDVEEWKAALGAKLDAIQTVRESAEFRMEMNLSGMKYQQSMSMEFLYRRPDAVAAKGPFAEIYCLGTNAVISLTFPKKTYSRRVVDGLADLLDEDEIGMLMLTPDKKMLLAANEAHRAMALEELFSSAEARRLPDEELDGRTCVVLATPFKMWFDSKWAKVWFDAETGLPRRAESIPTPEWVEATDEEEEDRETMRMMRDMSFTYTVTVQEVNVPLDDDAFAFVPPEGAVEDSASLEELIERSETRSAERASGLSRFELSGQPAPDFELPLLDGGTFRLSEQAGKVVVIDFWATWCGPCVRALPEMRKLAEAYADQPDVVLVGFSTDAEKDREKVADLVRKHELEYAIGLGPKEAKDAYKVSGIPCIVVVGPDGTVQGRKVGFSSTMVRDLQTAVDTLLAGEELASAKPFSEEELKKIEDGACSRCGKVHSCSTHSRRASRKMDEQFFRLRWSRDVQAGGRRGGPSSVRTAGVESRLPPTHLVRVAGGQATLLDPEDGREIRVVDLPDSMTTTNEMGQVPYLVYVRGPDGGAIAGYQERYKVRGTESNRHFETERSEVMGLPLDGGEAWSVMQERHQSIRNLIAVPVSADEDLLAISSWSQVSFYDAKGRLVLKQALENGTQAQFIRSADGALVFLVEEPARIAAYDVIWTRPSADAAPEPTEDREEP